MWVMAAGRDSWSRYFVTFNVTAPYNPISVGPRFMIGELVIPIYYTLPSL